MNRFIIIDGNAILHRAYHALPPLTDPNGRVVNAVYGFTTMLLKLVTDLTPSYLAVCFDRPKPTFRKELFAGYQAKRPKMDDDLVPQIGILHELLNSFHIPIYEVDGFEADDVIGTLVHTLDVGRQTSDDPIDQVVIVTGDRDILQLVVDEKVLAYMPMKGLSEAKLYGENEVRERLGVLPQKIPDYKGLAGDASDNYPGVPGIGPKTAVSLLDTYGSVEGVYAAVEENKTNGLSQNTIEKLKTGKESALLSKNLATIRSSAPIDFVSADCVLPDLATEEAKKFLGSLNFHSLVKRLSGGKTEKEEKKETKKKTPSNNSEQLTLV